MGDGAQQRSRLITGAPVISFQRGIEVGPAHGEIVRRRGQCVHGEAAGIHIAGHADVRFGGARGDTRIRGGDGDGDAFAHPLLPERIDGRVGGRLVAFACAKGDIEDCGEILIDDVLGRIHDVGITDQHEGGARRERAHDLGVEVCLVLVAVPRPTGVGASRHRQGSELLGRQAEIGTGHMERRPERAQHTGIDIALPRDGDGHPGPRDALLISRAQVVQGRKVARSHVAGILVRTGVISLRSRGSACAPAGERRRQGAGEAPRPPDPRLRIEIIQSTNRQDGRREGSGNHRVGDIGEMRLAVHIEPMDAGVKDGFDLRLAAGKGQMAPPGRQLAHCESARREPLHHRRNGRIGGAEALAILRGGQPAMVLARLRILLVEQKLIERPLLRRCLGEDDLEAAHAKRARRLARIEAGQRKAVHVPAERRELLTGGGRRGLRRRADDRRRTLPERRWHGDDRRNRACHARPAESAPQFPAHP